MGGRRQNEAGIVEEILDAAFEKPIAGLIALIFFGGLGIVFRVLAGVGSQSPLVAMMFTFGSYGAFALAAVGIVGGLIGTLGRLVTGRPLFGRSSGSMPLPDWNAVLAATPEKFEQIIADLYRRRGYRVQEVGGPGDGGIDLILQRPNDPCETLVQCKHYRVQSVGPAAVRELFGTMAAHPTRCEGILITTGRFTPAARTFAGHKPHTAKPSPLLYPAKLLSTTVN